MHFYYKYVQSNWSFFVLFRRGLEEGMNSKIRLFQWSLFFSCKLENQTLKILTLIVSSSSWNLAFKILSWDFSGMQNRKSRNTWSKRQIWPWTMERSRAKANRVLPRERTGHSKHPLPATQEKSLHMDITRWQTSKSDWLYSLQPHLEKPSTVTETRPGADCGSDHELLIAKFRLKLKKVGKTTKLFWSDLNQIPYDYTVEVRNRFKGLDLIECLMNYGMWFVTLYRRQGSRPSPWKRNARKQNGCLGRTYK